MHELSSLAAVRARMFRHASREFVRGSKLRLAVVVGLVVGFWALMFAMFLDGFRFLRSFPGISAIITDYLFAFFFLSMMLMMTISNAIIAYTSLFRTKETEFLCTLPLRAENAFAYRSGDSIVFSVWGMATLVAPMIVAYAAAYPVSPIFLPFAFALTALFIVLATELGAFIALLVGLLLPRRRRTVLGALGGCLAVAGTVWFLPVLRQGSASLVSEGTIRTVMDRIAFCQHWALPSRWVSSGILSASRGELRTAGFQTTLLFANTAFLGIVAHRFGYYAFRRAWASVQGSSWTRQYRSDGAAVWVLRRLLFFVPRRLRLLVLKDVKTFLRDPAQWSQFLLFFGLLGLYIVNLPQFGVRSLERYWHSLIASLNLCATCLTLATLTSRFVFPQLSLEGRRIWITGLLPMRRTLILWGKFLFAATGTFVGSAALIALSDLVIGLPMWTVGIHLIVVAGVCCGLNGLAVGLGALYPRLGTDSPAKIVSSFGGTLNLICSIGLLVLAVAPVIVPLHLHQLGVVQGGEFAASLTGGLVVSIGVSAAACVAPMLAGARAFARMEF